MTKLKNALLITGAAARISQEVALIDELIDRKILSINQDDTYLAGFSSGSLNIAAINACFRKTNPKDWNIFYKQDTLFSIKSNDEIYIQKKPLPWDTLALRKKLDKFLRDSDLSKDSDFPFNSDIITFSDKKLKTFWVNSKNTDFKDVKLSDLLMASCAIPILFPHQKINGIDNMPTNLPDGYYSDGGTGGTFKNFKKKLKAIVKTNNEAFENIFITSPMRHSDEIMANEDHLNKISDQNLEDLKKFFGKISMNGFIKFLKKLEKANRKNKLSKNIFVSMPNLDKNADILNFATQKDNYNKVHDWAKGNPDACMTINDFIKLYNKKK